MNSLLRHDLSGFTSTWDLMKKEALMKVDREDNTSGPEIVMLDSL